MSVGLIALLLLTTLVACLLAVAALQENAAFDRQVIASADPLGTARPALVARLDEALARTDAGRRLVALLAGAGLTRWSPAVVVLGTVGAASAAAAASVPLLGRAGAVVAMAAVVASVKGWLDRRRRARVERFIAQLPEVARLLANSADAGLAVRRGVEIAAREMAEPAASELGQVAAELSLGRTLRAALAGLSERLPSRELAVLVQTLTIQARAGGALVTALAGIAATLEDRRQLRREIRTAMVGASFSGYLVILMGLGAVILINVLNPGVLDVMLTNLVGQGVVGVSAALFLLGYLMMRRLGRVEP
ncbi:type II secretion system F family protein [Xylanimonas ulmi]|uniref:Tight adherence protein B n=1 Tax=Xylanimonas ulmi TaxID=228973 RepID=A0A4Q7M5Z3_9MICO|nr:type II secretion system F family protein [Xylanibacterium ulmi]RZS63084.1 tight adherence protein B [Xylanibacterium ulmi]